MLCEVTYVCKQISNLNILGYSLECVGTFFHDHLKKHIHRHVQHLLMMTTIILHGDTHVIDNRGHRHIINSQTQVQGSTTSSLRCHRVILNSLSWPPSMITSPSQLTLLSSQSSSSTALIELFIWHATPRHGTTFHHSPRSAKFN